MPTRRTLLILAASAAFFVIAGLSATAAWVGLVADVVVLTLFVLDRRSLPRRGQVRIRRQFQPVFSLCEPNRVALTVRNESPRALRGVLQDNPPDGFPRSPESLAVSIPPRSEGELHYALTPLERGRFAFQPGVLRAYGPMGLSLRDYRFPPAASAPPEPEEPREVTVYPSVSGVTALRMAAYERRVESGYHRLRRQVEGTSPSQIREYVPGDSYRHIHWKATARYDRPMVLQFDVDTNQTLYVFVDCGRLMRLPVGRLRKLDYAVNACADLARVAIDRGDSVGVCCFSHRVSVWHEAKGKRAHFLRILDSLAAVQADHRATNYREPVNMFLARVQRRSLCVFLTSLSESESTRELVRRLKGLRAQHVPAVISLSDPALEDALQGAARDYEGVCRKLAAADIHEEIAVLAQDLRRHGGYFLQVPADGLSLAAVQTYLDAKSRGLL